MRIIEPQQYKQKTVQKSSRKRKIFGLFGMLLFVCIVGIWFWSQSEQVVAPDIMQEQAQANPQTTGEESSVVAPEAPKQKVLREFSDQEFVVFYDNLVQPNLLKVENPPSISGNEIADARIRSIAEQRGYKLRSSPELPLGSTQGFAMQSPVVESWLGLQQKAAQAGYTMSLVSTYRSVENQRQLFLSRLSATGATIDQVANGLADSKVNQVLVTSSIPGYSKHHTGYAIDLLCAGYAFENFKNSPCHDWLKANNYAIAKEFGFIPSYPDGAALQGPDPEAWEYVWVGTDLLYEYR